MKLDISSRKDIKFIISEFYNKLLVDEKMMPFFEEIVSNNQLEHHLEIITDFWEDILFDTTLYKNNTMEKHKDKHVFVTFKEVHFTLWISYLFDVIDTNFIGLITSNMKNKATSIAMIMKLKMNVYKKKE
jgi:hemoglobin